VSQRPSIIANMLLRGTGTVPPATAASPARMRSRGRLAAKLKVVSMVLLALTSLPSNSAPLSAILWQEQDVGDQRCLH
jgi:hypothetical protein